MKYCNRVFTCIVGGMLLIPETATATVKYHSVPPHYTQTLELFNAGNYLMLECQLNGKSAYFMVDTGASFSIIDNRMANTYQLTVLERQSLQLTGFGTNRTTLSIAINAEFEFNERKIPVAILVQDLSKMRRLIESDSGVWITGIIGTDILKILGCSIDLGRKVIRWTPGD